MVSALISDTLIFSLLCRISIDHITASLLYTHFFLPTLWFTLEMEVNNNKTTPINSVLHLFVPHSKLNPICSRILPSLLPSPSSSALDGSSHSECATFLFELYYIVRGFFSSAMFPYNTDCCYYNINPLL